MAAGRENRFVDKYFLEDHPAVMRLIEMVVQEAGDTPVGMCGELAGNIKVVPQLVGMGIRTPSMVPTLVPPVKEAVRGTNIQTRNRSE